MSSGSNGGVDRRDEHLENKPVGLLGGQVAEMPRRDHRSGRRIGRPSAKIQHLRTSTSAIEGLTKMARAASVLSAWRSSQMSARRSEFRGARQKNRRFSDVSARQKGAGRPETEIVQALQRPSG